MPLQTHAVALSLKYKEEKRSLMKFKKKDTTKTYEITPIGKVTHISLATFIKTRERYGCETDSHKKCFMCDTPLDINQEHNEIAVSGSDNTFVCDTCYAIILQKNNKKL